MAKEMHLVDPKMLERLMTPSEPKQRVLNQLDREMQAILERQDLPDREKVTMYNQVLQRYLNYKTPIHHHPLPQINTHPTLLNHISYDPFLNLNTYKLKV